MQLELPIVPMITRLLHIHEEEYVETEKVHFVHKMPILNLEEKNKEICISDGKSGNQEIRQKMGRRKK